MKAIPFKVPKLEQKAIRVQHDVFPHFYDKMHYHKELQITTIIRGNGILHGGNAISQFQAGDVFLIGENIPHLFKSSPEYFTIHSPGIESISLFFDLNSLGKGFFDVQEMRELKTILTEAQRVIKVEDDQLKNIHTLTLKFKQHKRVDIIIQFLKLLQAINLCRYKILNAPLYQFNPSSKSGERLNQIITYTYGHLHRPISIDEISKISNLSKSQFSRYFKSETGKSYIEFLNELRIESSCTLLKEEKLTIANICYQVGFQNLSNFNRKFREIKRCTPSQYRERIRQ